MKLEKNRDLGKNERDYKGPYVSTYICLRAREKIKKRE